MTSKKTIPAQAQVPFRRWEMPDLTGIKRSIARRLDELEAQDATAEQEEAVVPPQLPTAEEIEALRAEAEQAGFQAGQEAGQAAGYEAGRALGYQEGEAQGQAAGFQAGYQRGLEEAQHEIDAQLARLSSLVHQLQGPIQELDLEVEQALLGLVDQVCRALIRRELSLGRDYLLDIIKESIAALPPGYQRLNIHFHPDDLPLVQTACASLLDRYQLTPNPNMTPGGVELETRQSLVDATLEQRYKKLVGKLVANQYQQSLGEMESLADVAVDTPDMASAEQDMASSQSTTPVEPERVSTVSEQAAEPDLYAPSSTEQFVESSSVMPTPSAASLKESEITEPADLKSPDREMLNSEAFDAEVLGSEMLDAEAVDPAADVFVDTASAPVSRVSLQRQSAPRQPIAAAPDVQSAPIAEAADALPDDPQSVHEPEQIASVLPSNSEAASAAAAIEEAMTEETVSDSAASEALSLDTPKTEQISRLQEAMPEEMTPAEDSQMSQGDVEEVPVRAEPEMPLDDFNDDAFFAQSLQTLDSEMVLPEDEIDAELDALLSSVQQEEEQDILHDADDQDHIASEPPEAQWAPDSVHEGRYLQEDNPEAWADDFLNEPDEPFEEITPKSQGPVSG